MADFSISRWSYYSWPGCSRCLFLLDHSHEDRSTATHDAGIVSEESASVRLSAKFCLVAVLFVVFDLEAAFILQGGLLMSKGSQTDDSEATKDQQPGIQMTAQKAT